MDRKGGIGVPCSLSSGWGTPKFSPVLVPFGKDGTFMIGTSNSSSSGSGYDSKSMKGGMKGDGEGDDGPTKCIGKGYG